MSFGGGGSSANNQTQLDPQIKQAWLDLYGRATNVANGAVPQQAVAGFTPAGLLGQQMTLGAAGAGQDAVGRAAQAAGALAGFQAPSITPALTGTDHYGAHLADAAQAGGITSQSTPDSTLFGYRDVGAPSFGGPALQEYENPYTDQVVNASLNDLDLARRRAVNQNSSDFTANGGEGAWNGARAGVADAGATEAYLRQVAQLSPQLRSQAYDNAAGLMKDYGAMGLQAQQANQNADLARDQAIYGGTLQTNMANQAATNAIAENNAQRQQQANLSNAAAETQKERDNATINNQAMQFNANQAQQASLQDALNAIASAGVRTNAAGELANMGGQQQSMALSGANAVSGVGQQQQSLLQHGLDADYANQMAQRNLPLQAQESAFGIIPSTGSGSVTHSSGKSGNVGF
jgi:hypothetical protein